MIQVKYKVKNFKKEPGFEILSEGKFEYLFGDEQIREYVDKIYYNKIIIDSVPQELQDKVKEVVARRIDYFGSYEE